MRKTLYAAVAVLSIMVASLVLPASPAAAAPKCRGYSVKAGIGVEGALAFCYDGTAGDIRVRIVCIREAKFTKYTKWGVWRYDNGPNVTYSEAYCNGVDALVSHNHEVA
jgi:hypothetical protein